MKSRTFERYRKIAFYALGRIPKSRHDRQHAVFWLDIFKYAVDRMTLGEDNGKISQKTTS